MEKYPHLSKAPIHEALIDIRVCLPTDFDSKTFLEAEAAMKEEGYPKVEQCWEFTAGIEFKAEQSSFSQNRNPKGYWFKAADQSAIMQFRKDGFTFNKLKPYSSWDDIQKSAKKGWARYEKIAKDISVSRVAVRYINHIDLPLPLKNIDQFFSITPDIGGRQNKSIKGFTQRIILQEDEIAGQSGITFASQASPIKGNIRILLDIDVSKDFSSDADMPKKNDLWEILDICSRIKNRLFFANIKDKTIEMYK